MHVDKTTSLSVYVYFYQSVSKYVKSEASYEPIKCIYSFIFLCVRYVRKLFGRSIGVGRNLPAVAP